MLGTSLPGLTRTVEGLTVRVYNAAGFGFMTLESDSVSSWFDSLFGGKLVGARHAEDDDCTRGEPAWERREGG